MANRVDTNQLRIYRDAVAIITGAASGIGRALAEVLAQRGAEVVLADLQIELAEQAAAGIRSRGGRARAVLLDVADFPAFERVVQETVALSGRLDFMFNNAGIVIAGEVKDYRIEDWNRILDVNLRGVIHGVQASYSVLVRQGFGHIVNTASISGLIPSGGLVGYCTTKHAVVGLSTALRVEAAVAGIRVSVLCPGAVHTAIAEGGRFGKIVTPISREEFRRLWERQRPMAPEQFAREALVAVAGNRAIIVIPWRWKLRWWSYRLMPTLFLKGAEVVYLATRKLLLSQPT